MEYKTIDMTADDTAALKFLYKTLPGRVLLRFLASVYASKSVGLFLGSRVSRIFINGFIRRKSINMKEYKKVRFGSFNAFFIRKIKKGARPLPSDNLTLPAACDGKLTVYRISKRRFFRVKNSVYNVGSLLKDAKLSKEYSGGHCLIFRLTPDDYHRYVFIDDGEITKHRKINGFLHTVRPIALDKYKIFAENAREYTVMQTQNFGKVTQIEVGAMFVGKIHNHKKSGAFKRGEEKGYFAFGGSTVIQLFTKDAITPEGVFCENTAANLETVVKQGYSIGKSFLPEVKNRCADTPLKQSSYSLS